MRVPSPFWLDKLRYRDSDPLPAPWRILTNLVPSSPRCAGPLGAAKDAGAAILGLVADADVEDYDLVSFGAEAWCDRRSGAARGNDEARRDVMCDLG